MLNPHHPSWHRRRARSGGFTLVETMAAVLVVAIALGAVLLLNSHLLKMVRTAKEANAATMMLLERAEQVRIANWLKITDANTAAAMLDSRPTTANTLGDITERITIRDYSADPNATPRVAMIVEKVGRNPARVIDAGTGLQNERIARVDMNLTWVNTGGRVRMRESSTVISNVGVSRLSLPGFGGNGGPFADFPTDDPLAPSGSTGTGSTGTGSTGTGSTGTGTGSTGTGTGTSTGGTSTGGTASNGNNGNGNGKGNGNTGGKTGKN